MSRAILLSWHGTVLYADAGGGLSQRPFFEAPQGAAHITLPADFGTFAQFLSGAPGRRFLIASGALAGWMATPVAERRGIALARGKHFLSAPPGQTAIELRGEIDEGAVFLPIRIADVGDLLTILTHDWLLRDREHLVTRDAIAVTSGHRLRLGPLLLDLADLVPFEGDTLPRHFTWLQDGWRIQRARRYQPLICFAAFRDLDIFVQLRIALETLFGFGSYAGPVLLFTDASPARLSQVLAGIDLARVMVQRLRPMDRLGCVAARYAVVDCTVAQSFQPILYCDTDIVFDRPVAPLLQALAACDRLAAPAEDFSLLASAVSVGADLLTADMADPRYAIGFNAGTLGIPDMVTQAPSLRLIRRILVNRADLLGRNRGGFVDQPVANYVAYRTGAFDTDVLTPYVRYGWPGIETDTAGRRGLVHFFPPRGARAKHEAMARYCAALAAAD